MRARDVAFCLPRTMPILGLDLLLLQSESLVHLNFMSIPRLISNRLDNPCHAVASAHLGFHRYAPENPKRAPVEKIRKRTCLGKLQMTVYD